MKTTFAVSALVLTLSGCAVGPDFKRPALPENSGYSEGAHATQTPVAAGIAQHFNDNAAISADWWQLFQSPVLNQLVKTALDNSPTIDAAHARFDQAQAVLDADYGALYPQVTANLGAQRQKPTSIRFGTIGTSNAYNLYSGSIGVSYAIDIFGYSRRALERDQASLTNQHMQLRAAQLTLTANVINSAFQIASLTAQIDATQAIIQNQQNLIGLAQQQYKAGLIANSDVLSLQSQIATTQALLPPLQQRLGQTRHLLATYLGATPANAQISEIHLSDFQLPVELPLSLPTDLVHQRPDILASEAQLTAANAQVGVSTAALYPHVSLNASFGQNSLKLASLFDPVNNLWSLAANLAQPIFDGGTLKAQQRQAQAAYRESLANYKQTLLNAFSQVADVLGALQHDAESLAIQQQAAQTAEQAGKLVDLRYQAGKASYIDLLNAQRQTQQSQLAVIQAQTQRLQDTAALFTALGGGWWSKT